MIVSVLQLIVHELMLANRARLGHKCDKAIVAR